MSPRRVLFVALCSLALASCGGSVEPGTLALAATTQPDTPAPTTVSSAPGRTATDAPAIPSASATLRSSATAAEPAGGCPPAPTDVPLPEIDDPQNAGQALVGYLNAGGAAEALRELALPASVFNDLGTTGEFALADLNRDGVAEIALSLVDLEDSWQQNRVYVMMCAGGRYQLGYQTDLQYTDNHIGPAYDLTGDGQDELLIVRSNCGAHTCFEWVAVVSWHNGELANLMQEQSFDLPSTGIQLFGPLMDGSYQIYMTGNGIASVGAGPYQRRSVTWNWDPQAYRFRPGEVRMLPSEYRIHHVHDGDRSFAIGNYALALEFYNRAIRDDALRDWPSQEFASDERRFGRLELAAYARFRRVLTRIKMDDTASAEVHYLDLLDEHPPGEPGDGFAAMGKAFWQEFSASGDYNAACLAAQQYATVHPNQVLAHLEYGYGNPTYAPEGLCPVGG